MWTSVRSLVLVSERSLTGLMLIEEVPTDREVMAAIEELVCSVHEWCVAQVCKRSKRGIVRDSK